MSNIGINQFELPDGEVVNIEAYNGVTGVKGDAESSYRVGNINITPTNIGLGNVDNTADAVKQVSYASTSGDAATVGGFSVGVDVPANAVFTDTTYNAATSQADGLMSSTDKSKLDDIESGAEVNVQSDWDETISTSDSYIQNKPTLGSASSLNVAASGDASASEVVKGDDSRLSDARNAADVSSWAKASTKPSYTASEVGAIASSLKGTASGVAELDANGKVPSSQLPSFVDDILEYSTVQDFPATGESGKLYVATTTNKTYRWSGSGYVEVSESVAIGETSSTAYRGDRGKTAYDHSQTTGNPHGTTKSDVGLGNVGNFKAVSTVASQGLTSTEQANARANIGAGTSSLTLGTSAGTACEGNDSRLSNARPASDVYSWAKASTKPSYSVNLSVSNGALSVSVS